MAQYTTHEFQKKIDDEVRAICREYGTNYDKDMDRGVAFQVWFGRLLVKNDRELDTDVDDAVLRSRELGIDLVFADETRQHQYLIQCKFTGTSKKAKQAEVSEDEVKSLFSKHVSLMDRKWVRDHASAAALDLLGDYPDKIANGWRMHFYFVTTANASERVQQLAPQATKDFAHRNLDIECTLLDLSRLKDFFQRGETLDQSVPDQVELDLPAKSFFEKKDPHPTIVAVVKGNSLRNLHQKYRESLFAWNIRGYLGNRGLNKDMASTAEKTPADFFYYNNGIAAICTDYTLTGNKVTARKFQVINGAQTIGTLSKSDPHDEVEVLFRLTKTDEVNIEKGINRNIIQYNNTQNVIKLSDFRSNDKIQLWLEKQFKEVKNYQSVPSLAYLRKRGQHPGPLKALRLEEFAKIRYAFKYEPTLLYERPKDLWTPKEDGGVYERAFGDGADILPSWTEEMFEEALFAVAVSLRRRVCRCGQKSGRSYVHRLRFHLLALLGMCARQAQKPVNLHAAVKTSAKLDEFWNEFWPDCRKVLMLDYNNSVGIEAGKMTLHAYMRSDERWKTMVRTITDVLNLLPPK